MKISAIVLLAVLATSFAQDGPTQEVFDCPGVGLFPDAVCTKWFWSCYDFDQYGDLIGESQMCPGELIFDSDPTEEVCNYWWEAPECPYKPPITTAAPAPTTTTPVPTEPEPTTPEPTTPEPTTPEPTTPEPTTPEPTTPEPTTPEPNPADAICKKAGFNPDPSDPRDCTIYYYCELVGDKWSATECHCNEGLYFNSMIEVCTFDPEAGCKQSGGRGRSVMGLLLSGGKRTQADNCAMK